MRRSLLLGAILLSACVMLHCGPGNTGQEASQETHTAQESNSTKEQQNTDAAPLDAAPERAPVEDTPTDEDQADTLPEGPQEGPLEASPEQPCVPTAESCNGKDDDCDGEIDEGLYCVNTLPMDASLRSPRKVAIDSKGNLYVADPQARKVFIIGKDQSVKTFAGNGRCEKTDGPRLQASLCAPYDVAIDSKDNLYIADAANHTIRKIDTSGNVTTFAGTGGCRQIPNPLPGPGKPKSVYVDCFRNGPRAQAQFNSPTALAIGPNDELFIIDRGNFKIRKIDTNGDVTTIAGSGLAGGQDPCTNRSICYQNGPGDKAEFQIMNGLAVDKDGNIYIADSYNNRIRKISFVTKAKCADQTDYTGYCVSLFSGGSSPGYDGRGFLDGPADKAKYNYPVDIETDPSGHIYVADHYNHRIRKIDTSGEATTIAGHGPVDPQGGGYQDGPALRSLFNHVAGLARGPSGTLYLADLNNLRIRKIAQVSKAKCGDQADYTGLCVSTYAGSGIRNDYNFVASHLDNKGNLLIASWLIIIRRDLNGKLSILAGVPEKSQPIDGPADKARFMRITDIAYDPKDDTLYIADDTFVRKLSYLNNDTCIVKQGGKQNIPNYTGYCLSTIAGNFTMGDIDGPLDKASFSSMRGITVGPSGALFISTKNRVRKLDLKQGMVTTITDKLANARGLTVDPNGTIFVTSNGTSQVFSLTQDGTLSVFAGSGVPGFNDGDASTASFTSPSDVTTGPKQNTLFVTDGINVRLLTSNPLQGKTTVTTVAGGRDTKISQSKDGPGTQATFMGAISISFDGKHTLYITQTDNTIRTISLR